MGAPVSIFINFEYELKKEYALEEERAPVSIPAQPASQPTTKTLKI
jgi:hypothetical protein